MIETDRRPESPRKRVLVDPETGSVEEPVEVWKALDDSAPGDVIRLLILTGRRRNEIAGLQWSQLDEGLTRIRTGRVVPRACAAAGLVPY
jgi:integrase